MLAVSREGFEELDRPAEACLTARWYIQTDVQLKDQVYTVNDYADDGGRTWMNANVPFTVY